MNVDVLLADYSNKQHAADIVQLLNSYALDPMGGGEPLDSSVKRHLVAELSNIPHAFSILCYVDGDPAGLVNGFEGFSTFACKPLINVHDIVVSEHFRGHGISQRLLAKVEEIARDKGCCKITLEVLEGNTVAQAAYRKHGFNAYELNPATGKALFWQKPVNTS